MICQDCGREQGLDCSYQHQYVGHVTRLAYPCKGFIPELVALRSIVQSRFLSATLRLIKGLDHDYAQLEWMDGETVIEVRYYDHVWTIRMMSCDVDDCLHLAGIPEAIYERIRQEIARTVAR